MTIEVTSWNSEWEKLHSTYLTLLEDIKKQVAKNEYLSGIIIELEGTIEKYNTTIVGGEAYLKQQLEVLARSQNKNSINYISHRRDVVDTQNEISNLRQKIGRIDATRFNNSAVHQRINVTNFDQSVSNQSFQQIQQVGGNQLGNTGNYSNLDLSSSANNILNRSTVFSNPNTVWLGEGIIRRQPNNID